MRILVTGGGGFVGQNLVKKLIDDGHQVIVTASGTDHIVPGAQVSYCGLYGFNRTLLRGVDVVYHLAANNDTTFSDREEMFRVNHYDTVQLLNQCCEEKVKRFIYASSTAVYGNGPVPYDEAQEPNPANAYAESKMMFDLYMKIFKRDYDIPILGFRFCNMYGPGESHKGKRMSMIGQLIRKMKRGETPKLFKWGEQKRDWLYVTDAVQACLLAMEKGESGVYNIGSGVAYSFLELIQNINEVLGTQIEPEFVDCPFGDSYQNHTCCKIEKAQVSLGFFPNYTLRSGIEEYVKLLD